MRFAAGGSPKGTTLKSKMTALAASAALVASLGAPAVASARTTLIGSGSSAEQPIMQLLFSAYSRANKSIRFAYTPDGGNAGVKDVQQGRSQFAINTRPPLPSDGGTTQFKIFLDGLCVGVNPSNSLSNITLAALKNVFLGLTTNWSDVAGSSLSTAIDPIGRNSTAGSYTFFQTAVLGGKTQASNVLPETSDGLVAQGIKNDGNAIGYVGLAHAGSGSGVKTLAINGIACNQSTIKAETYPLFRYIWAVIPSASPNSQVEKFIQWVRTSKPAGQVINLGGAVPAFNKK
jgi:ABC-type phosphate transport system substrate-binding protein